MSDKPRSFRAREQARRDQRAADERRMRRLFWVGLLVPAMACAIVALVIGPDSWLGWAAVVATAPAAAACVAVVLMLQDRAAERR
jgi:fatty acid desaturase